MTLRKAILNIAKDCGETTIEDCIKASQETDKLMKELGIPTLKSITLEV